jgi:hypothetical protein
MLRRLAARPDPPRPLSEAAARRLYELGGGHAGLMRALFFATTGEADALAPDAVERLAAHADIRAECRKILDSLEEQERADLGRIAARGQAPSSGGLRRLVRRGLVRERFSRSPELLSPVLERALAGGPAVGEGQAASTAGLAEVEFIGVGLQVRVKGRLVADLTPPEYEILRCLAQSRPRPCPRAELIPAMLKGEGGKAAREAAGSPPRRLEHYLERLKRKLDPRGQLIRAEGDGVRLA